MLLDRKAFGRMEITLIYLVLIAFALAYLVPFLWLVSGSVKSNTELFATPPIWVPPVLHGENFVQAFTDFPFLRYLLNTLFIVVMNVVGTVVSSALVAYAFAKLEWKLREPVFYLVLVTMMLPFQVLMIPLYLLFNGFGWIGTFLPLVVTPFFGHAFSIFLYRQFFLGIPKELSESAQMDGAGHLRIFVQVVLPLAQPAVTTVGIFTFLRTWSDFIGPLLFLSDNKLYTLSLGVQQIMSANDPRWPVLMAVGVAMTLPVLVLFFLLQKFFIQGIATSGLKG